MTNGFTLTPHLIRKAEDMGVPLSAIWEIIDFPENNYPSFVKDDGKRVERLCNRCGAPQRKWTGTTAAGAFCIVVFPCCKKAITFWPDQVETELRPDQKAAGVTKYQGKDGRWRS